MSDAANSSAIETSASTVSQSTTTVVETSTAAIDAQLSSPFSISAALSTAASSCSIAGLGFSSSDGFSGVSQAVFSGGPLISSSLWSSPTVFPFLQTPGQSYSSLPWQTFRPASHHTLPPPSSIPASQFFGSTFTGSPGVVHPPEPSIFGSPMASLIQSLSPISNVSQIVTIKLKAVEDYLTWRTQSFLVSQGLFGMLDGSIPVPLMYTVDFNNCQVPNTEYYHWLRVDQTIRSWLFATLTRDVLVDVHDLKHSFGIWERLQTRFMSASLPRCMELKRQLNNLKKRENQSMDHYLRDIKNLIDALAAVNSPVSAKELLESTLRGLGPEYESLVGTIMLFPEQFPFEILQPRLMEAEQRVLFNRQQASQIQPAFAAVEQQPPQQPYAPRGRGGRGRGGRSRGRGGRGRHNYGQRFGQQYYGQQHQAGPVQQFGQHVGPPLPV
ncbi:unnamed protein product [Cuscuta epithymum]|uniref:Retrotransposon gag domain-containing protein n=1 Tax=Cuscuta epithymum TaxID=186058 RepID=A0AAV0CMT7_9ASTE|nr:unnamed protein product [Cuscuta epithymum]